MPRHEDFQKIHGRFVKQYGQEKGKSNYYAWLSKKGHTEEKAFPKGKEKKEKRCIVKGLEIKETELEFHVTGLIATTHIDNLDYEEGIDVPDMISKDTLDSFAEQINDNSEARIMGVHHSEGRSINAEYYGVADIDASPARVVELTDGEFGLYVDTKLLKSDPATPGLIKDFKNGTYDSFSITYDTNNFMSTDFDWMGDKLVRVLQPDTKLYGYTAATDPVNPNARVTDFGFKEFKELFKTNKEGHKMEEETPNAGEASTPDESTEQKPDAVVEEEATPKVDAPIESGEDAEQKEFRQWKQEKKLTEQKEFIEQAAEKITKKVMESVEVKEKVLKSSTDPKVSLELKEFRSMINDVEGKVELKEQARRCAAVMTSLNLDWQEMTNKGARNREYKDFGTNGRNLEYKGLGLSSNRPTDSDYIQSATELQDVFDPFIYNAINQETMTWNVLAKDDLSKKGNNLVQFKLKTVANTSAAFYSGNSVSTGNVTRANYQTKMKKIQVGVSVDGDMIAAARGGPVNDVFAQEVLDSTQDMMCVVNAALYGIKGAETDVAIIGFEYLANDNTYTSLYGLTRSSTNKLAPDTHTDNYINQSSTRVTMTNLRALKRNATDEGAKKRNLIYFCNPLQADMMRAKFDDSRRMMAAKDTDFGFSTDLFIDGIPVFEDIDCNTDDWFCVDSDSHRVGIEVPPTVERLGKTGDSEDAFIKMYCATYNRLPRAIGMIYGCATS